MWGVIGPELIRRGLGGGTPEQLRRVARAFGEIDRIRSEAADPAMAVRLVGLLDEAFAALAEATGNGYFTGLARRLSGDLARTWVIVLSVDPSAVLIGDSGLWGDPVPPEDLDAVVEGARQA
ncbi:hypothetical protein ACKI2D_43130 [Streptomyces europaeiscabiei]